MASRKELVGILEALLRLIEHADSIDAVRGGGIINSAQMILESAARGNIAPLPWRPLVPVPHQAPTLAQMAALARAQGLATDDVREQMERILREEQLWVNDTYQVSVRDLGDGGRHLSIKRVDQQPVHDWRDLQRIKDELIGVQCEAVELYPAEDRRVDTANQYHLWGTADPEFRFGFGFTERMVGGEEAGPHGQRPFAEEPADGR